MGIVGWFSGIRTLAEAPDFGMISSAKKAPAGVAQW
jgi:hypothetical protein